MTMHTLNVPGATWDATLLALRSEVSALRFTLALCHAAQLARLETKYSPDQPRVPAGRSDGGQWTDGDGGGGESRDLLVGGEGRDRLGSGAEFSPEEFGWHEYQAGPNHPCAASSDCSAKEIADYASRFAYPGQDPSRPVKDRGVYLVYFPGTRVPAGLVETLISGDGLTITNITQPLHLLYNGQIQRTFRRTPDGHGRL